MPEYRIKVPHNPCFANHFRQTAGRRGDHCTPPSESTVIETAQLAVHKPIYEDAVEPAFQDSWNTIPPERKLQYEHITPDQLLDLGGDVVAEAIVFRRVFLFAIVLQMARKAPSLEVCFGSDRVKTHRVQVRDDDFMVTLACCLGRLIEQGSIEGCWLRMGVDEKNFHFWCSLRYRWCLAVRPTGDRGGVPSCRGGGSPY